jgi:hypothetical protein
MDELSGRSATTLSAVGSDTVGWQAAEAFVSDTNRAIEGAG